MKTDTFNRLESDKNGGIANASYFEQGRYSLDCAFRD